MISLDSCKVQPRSNAHNSGTTSSSICLRSADFQSAVSPSCTRLRLDVPDALRLSRASQSATLRYGRLEMIGNLRYVNLLKKLFDRRELACYVPLVNLRLNLLLSKALLL